MNLVFRMGYQQEILQVACLSKVVEQSKCASLAQSDHKDFSINFQAERFRRIMKFMLLALKKWANVQLSTFKQAAKRISPKVSQCTTASGTSSRRTGMGV